MEKLLLYMPSLSSRRYLKSSTSKVREIIDRPLCNVVITNYYFEIIAYTLFRRCHCGKINLPLLTPALNWFLAKHLKHWLMDILPLRVVQCTSQFLNARCTIFGNSVLMTSS